MAYAMGILAFQIDGSFGKMPKMKEEDKKDAIEQMVIIRKVRVLKKIIEKRNEKRRF